MSLLAQFIWTCNANITSARRWIHMLHYTWAICMCMWCECVYNDDEIEYAQGVRLAPDVVGEKSHEQKKRLVFNYDMPILCVCVYVFARMWLLTRMGVRVEGESVLDRTCNNVCDTSTHCALIRALSKHIFRAMFFSDTLKHIYIVKGLHIFHFQSFWKRMLRTF